MRDKNDRKNDGEKGGHLWPRLVRKGHWGSNLLRVEPESKIDGHKTKRWADHPRLHEVS